MPPNYQTPIELVVGLLLGVVVTLLSAHNKCLRSIQEGVNSLMIDVSKLIAEVAAETTVEKSAVAVIQGLVKSQADLSTQLAAAIAANDPAALAAVQKAVDDSVAALQANDAELAAAITAGTPSAPTS